VHADFVPQHNKAPQAVDLAAVTGMGVLALASCCGRRLLRVLRAVPLPLPQRLLPDLPARAQGLPLPRGTVWPQGMLRPPRPARRTFRRGRPLGVLPSLRSHVMVSVGSCATSPGNAREPRGTISRPLASIWLRERE